MQHPRVSKDQLWQAVRDILPLQTLILGGIFKVSNNQWSGHGHEFVLSSGLLVCLGVWDHLPDPAPGLGSSLCKAFPCFNTHCVETVVFDYLKRSDFIDSPAVLALVLP